MYGALGPVEPTAAIERLSDAKRRVLDALLNREKHVRRASSDPLTRRGASASAPLSAAQEEIWRRAIDATEKPPFYNESITIHRRGPLNADALQRSLTEIVRRHEIWRTTFDAPDGGAIQTVRQAAHCLPISVYDLGALPESSRETEALRLASEQAREPFNLQTGPLVRFRLIHLDDTHHQLHATMHQIIVDGVSVFRVFPRELVKLYEAFADGHRSPLPEPGIQYRDFANWQREYLVQEMVERRLAYWQNQLKDKPPILQWPNDRHHFPEKSCRGSIVAGQWPKALLDLLRAVCLEGSVSLFTALLAGFVLLLHKYTNQHDLIVGTLAPAGRERLEVQELLGCFLMPVPLRFKLTPSMTFQELLCQAREVISDAVANGDVPFYRIVERVCGNSSPGENPFFDTVISLAPSVPDLGPGWTQTFMDAESGGSSWNLYLELNEGAECLMFRTQYNPDLFDATTIRRLTHDLKLLLEAAAAEPKRAVSELLRG